MDKTTLQQRSRPLTPKEAAPLMRIEQETARAWCRRGIWGRLINGRWYIEVEEVLELRRRDAID